MKRLLLVLVLLLSGCSEIDVPTKTNENGVEYSIVVIENMPCVIVQSPTSQGFVVVGITCDWSKYDD